MNHTVWRHGGRRSDAWLCVFSGEPAEARQRWERITRDMRQGRVLVLAGGQHPLDGDSVAALVRGEDGRLLDAYAPCLWARWTRW